MSHIVTCHKLRSQILILKLVKFHKYYFDTFVVEKFGNRDARDLDVYAKLTKQREFNVSAGASAEFTLGQ